MPGRAFQRGPAVVVEPDTDWQGPDTGVLTGHQVVATVITVEEGRATRVIRQPHLVSALAASRPGEADRV